MVKTTSRVVCCVKITPVCKWTQTVIPVAGISNWYDYSNSQGVSRVAMAHYMDVLSSLNAGSQFEDDFWVIPNDEYGAYVRQIAKDEMAANGNFEGPWPGMDYSDDYVKIPVPR